MNYELIKEYVAKEEYDSLMKTIEEKQRVSLVGKKYFIKIGKNSDELFFTNLKNEINLYVKNQSNNMFPKIIFSYIDDEYCVLVLEKIEGTTLSDHRNNFKTNLSEEERKNILKTVLKIKELDIDFETDKKYDREEKAKKYFEKSMKYLNENQIEFLNKNLDEIIKYDGENVLSHGDLINTNIMISKGTPKLLDWEFIGYRPISYDPAYFLLFSKDKNTFDGLTQEDFDMDIKEVYKDAFLIVLKEIQNFAKLFGKLSDEIVNGNIERWKHELDELIKLY